MMHSNLDEWHRYRLLPDSSPHLQWDGSGYARLMYMHVLNLLALLFVDIHINNDIFVYKYTHNSSLLLDYKIKKHLHNNNNNGIIIVMNFVEII